MLNIDDQIEKGFDKPIYQKRAYNKKRIAYYSIILLSATVGIGLFITGRYIIGVVIIVAAVVFAATYKFLKLSNEVEDDMHQVNVHNGYINELQEKFSDISFKRIEKVGDIYVTNPNNQSIKNDVRILKETQVKRALRNSLSPFVPQTVKNKLAYFSQEENKDGSKIYKCDTYQDLQPGETYAIQNIGHATLLIQIPGFNILTDPVFNNLSKLLYPEKTKSHIALLHHYFSHA